MPQSNRVAKPNGGEPPRRRVGGMALVLGVGALLLIGLPILAGLHVDYRWFLSLGLGSVFTTMLTARLALGVAVGSVLGIALYGNARLALRASEGLVSFQQVRELNAMPRIDLSGLLARAAGPVALVVGVMSGAAASSGWETWLQWVHASRFGVVDPIFGRDVGFYVFALPALEAAATLALWLVGLSLIASVAVYVLRGAIGFDLGRLSIHSRARTHLGVLGALLFLVFAFDAWLEMPGLLYSKLGPVSGASYADVHARLPALRVKVAIATVAAALVAISITRRRLVLVSLAALLYFGTEFLGVRLYSEAVHRFSVLPNEAVKEEEFITHNIAATREAYGLEHVVERDLSGELSLSRADMDSNRATLDNVRLWDHQPLLDTFAQIQEIRTYYEFASVDNDRYVIDGELRQTMLSPRELASESLPNRTWINEHFTFTHGYGATLGPVNEATRTGLPVLYTQDIPPVSSISEVKITRPGIYFGELSSDYVFVSTDTKEFDHPSGDKNVYRAYEGKAGVRLNSALNRALMAIRLGTLKLMLSEDISSESRVLLYRNIQERTRQIAPFLTFDRDPYMVVRDDGTLIWIQDAYTTSHRYPYSEPSGTGLNYIRNSVKIVIDAYDGTVDFYIADAKDPILKTWRRAFPKLFRPMRTMPADIQRHLRYPDDLFRVQTEIFSVYHMNQAELVYNREDQWEVPAITQGDNATRMEPYYTVMRLPEEKSAEFILMIPFTPKRKANLAAWMVARNDGKHRGELVVYRFPKDRLVFGPQQVMNRINQDAEISRQISLWDQRGSQAIFGTLLVIPIEKSLIYVSPLYLRSEGGQIPELKRVIVVYENRIAMEKTLDEAVATIFGKSAAERVETEAERASADSSQPASAPVAAQKERMSQNLGARAKQLYDDAVAAQRKGDWAAYGEALEELGDVLKNLARTAAQPSGKAQPSENVQPSQGKARSSEKSESRTKAPVTQ